MTIINLVIITVVLTLLYFLYGRQRAYSVAKGNGGIRGMHSLPAHYGTLAALWCLVPALFIILAWKLFEPSVVDSLLSSSIPEDIRAQGDTAVSLYRNEINNAVDSSRIESLKDPIKQTTANRLAGIQKYASWGLFALTLSVAALLGLLAVKRITPTLEARHRVEAAVQGFLLACASIAILTTIGIVLSVLFESLRFFNQISFVDFVTGLKWSPQTAIRADQVGSTGSFGAIPLFAGTLLISLIAMLVAVPFGLMSAIYLAEYATPRARSIIKPLLEMLAGIPTVVYGFFAALTVAPWIRGIGESVGLSVASESALAAGLVMGIMIIPFVSSLSDDVITAVPQSMRDGSFGLGATHSETIRKVVIPAALPGIVGGILLAASRAIGETMIVVMAAGLAANLTANPLEAVTTVTVQIVTLLTGDQEFDSAKTLAAFALGLMLFISTLVLNVIALYVVRRYREQYD